MSNSTLLPTAPFISNDIRLGYRPDEASLTQASGSPGGTRFLITCPFWPVLLFDQTSQMHIRTEGGTADNAAAQSSPQIMNFRSSMAHVNPPLSTPALQPILRAAISNCDSKPPPYPSHSFFQAPNADVILQSSDGILYHNFRWILAEASPVLREMLGPPPAPPVFPESLERIVLSEPASVLEPLLRLIYPVTPQPDFPCLLTLKAVLAAALKYEIALASNTLRRALVSPYFLENETLRVYAIACQFGLDDEAKTISRATLAIALLDQPLCEELKIISAYDYCRLLNLRRTRATAMKGVLVLRGASCPIRCSGCSNTSYESLGGLSACHGGVCARGRPTRPTGRVALWWIEWERRAKEEIARRPLTDVIFSPQFLRECVNGGCLDCGRSAFDSLIFLEKLKEEMDALPDVIEI